MRILKCINIVSDLWRTEVICAWVITSPFLRIIYEFIKQNKNPYVRIACAILTMILLLLYHYSQ